MRIAMSRGDIHYVRFLIDNLDGTPADINFTEIYFTVKKSFRNTHFCFQKKLSTGDIQKLDVNDYQLKIEPEDTAMMSIGDHVFDIQVDYRTTEEDILKETFAGDFFLKPEVTFPENE